MRKSIYTKELLQNAVDNCINFTQVCKYLGKIPKGGTYQHIQSKIREYNIDTSHFLGQASHTGVRHTGSAKKKRWEERLVSGYKRRMKSQVIRRALQESGRKYECGECGLGSEWQGKELTLHVHHIDGDWSNCVKENLEFLCPNCHAQEEDREHKKKRDAKKKQSKYGNLTEKEYKHHIKSRKVERPDYIKLKKQIQKHGIVGTSKIHNVAHSTIRKWVTWYEKYQKN